MLTNEEIKDRPISLVADHTSPTRSFCGGIATRSSNRSAGELPAHKRECSYEGLPSLLRWRRTRGASEAVGDSSVDLGISAHCTPDRNEIAIASNCGSHNLFKTSHPSIGFAGATDASALRALLSPVANKGAARASRTATSRLTRIKF